jgi:hypothetical protein
VAGAQAVGFSEKKAEDVSQLADADGFPDRDGGSQARILEVIVHRKVSLLQMLVISLRCHWLAVVVVVVTRSRKKVEPLELLR